MTRGPWQGERLARRREILERAGAREETLTELLTRNTPLEIDQRPTLPFEEEAHLPAWRGYAHESATRGAWTVVREKLVHLAFPVRAGTSQDPAWRASVLQGAAPPPTAPGLTLEGPDTFELRLVDTPGGPLPALIAGTRGDFERLVQALAHRGEPVFVPPAMGTCLVTGVLNWDRIRAHEARWLATPPPERDRPRWDEEFRYLKEHKELTQDTLILVSHGPYSGVAAPAGVAEAAWLDRSLALRLAHEGVHYFTLRAFGRLGHTVLEELVADWAACHAAWGRYDPALARQFLGLEAFPRYRHGGRLENYWPLDSRNADSFAVLCHLAWHAVARLAAIPPSPPDRLPHLLLELLSLSLEELADGDVRAPHG